MDIFFQILFWLSVFLIFHSYVLFPIILKISTRNKEGNTDIYKKTDDLPEISIILASYNEEQNIEQKIQTTFNTNYPIEKIEFLIGSDNSIDETNKIIEKYSQKYSQIKFYAFDKRQGKNLIINFLKNKAKNKLLILTDTKVFFNKETIFNLIKHFKNPDISIVGGILQNNKKNNDDISVQEHTYMNKEMQIKYMEGLSGKCSIGIFGALYAIKKEDLSDIPANNKVDDFFVTMKVLEKNKAVIFSGDAVAEQKITGNFKEEFKRKVRIATGNFQNLKIFKSFLKRPFSQKGYYYISHKVIRWIVPFLLLLAFIANLFLLHLIIYRITFIIYLISLCIPIIDFMLKKIHININLFRYFTHFYGMNIALATGYIKFIKGIDSGTWEPSKR